MTGAAQPTNDAPTDDIRPVVRTSMAGNMGLWIFVAILLVAGVMLFRTLSARQMEITAPTTQYQSNGGTISSLPPLALPDRFREPDPYYPQGQAMQPLPPTPAQAQAQFPQAAITRVVEVPAPRQVTPLPPAIVEPVIEPPRGPSIVYDATITPPLPKAASSAAAEDGEERVLATRLENPSFTVPKGTVIPAILESAMDSTRPGAVRALVTRDVKGFDGTRVLVPRGSRLYGEYTSDLNFGQNRAVVQWNRLLRPDGVTIDLDSPAADPLGRIGVRGKVNSHFWARFGGAFLQTVLDIGGNLATRQIDDAVVVALPGSTQNITRTVTEGMTQVRPTLTVRQGTSVSVFVARDLDFSSVDR